MAWQANKWSVIRGDEFYMVAIVLDALGATVNINGVTAIHARVRNGDASIVTKVTTTGWNYGFPDAFYVYGFHFSGAETLAFGTSAASTVELIVYQNAEEHTFTYLNSLTATDRKVV